MQDLLMFVSWQVAAFLVAAFWTSPMWARKKVRITPRNPDGVWYRGDDGRWHFGV